MRLWQRLVIVMAVLAACYAGSYLVISRRGYTEAAQWDIEGFYYFTPSPTTRWRILNSGARTIFAPLNLIDIWLGTGRAPASEPMREVSWLSAPVARP